MFMLTTLQLIWALQKNSDPFVWRWSHTHSCRTVAFCSVPLYPIRNRTVPFWVFLPNFSSIHHMHGSSWIISVPWHIKQFISLFAPRCPKGLKISERGKLVQLNIIRFLDIDLEMFCMAISGTWSPTTQSCFRPHISHTHQNWSDVYIDCVDYAPPLIQARLAHIISDEVYDIIRIAFESLNRTTGNYWLGNKD